MHFIFYIVKMCVDWFNPDNLPWTCDLIPVISNSPSFNQNYTLSCSEGAEGKCVNIL